MQNKRRADLTNADVARLRRLARSNVELFAIWVCKSALGMADAQDANPLLQQSKGISEPSALEYTELAWAILEKLTAMVRPGARRFDGYMSILYWFGKEWTPPEEIDRACFDRERGRSRKEGVVGEFLRSQMLVLESYIQSLLEVVYHGMPLYRKSRDGARLEWVSYADEDYIYLSKRGQYCDYIHIDSVPCWVTSYWFRPEHLDAYRQLFGDDYRDLSVDDVLVRREAFRRHIGAPTGNVVSVVNTSGSSLLNFLPQIMQRFYGEGYSATNPDTWTKQVAVTGWVRRALKASRREADSLDILTRPDQARRKDRG
ncbi:hypothetical protein ACFPN2_03340 [Steroidobacter flavus]|uniref:Uncharacterized protein n=1 Tax=Steroidobacter flavus TaxID=1842136 RepID=A0ABV8SL48_9GAMM